MSVTLILKQKIIQHLIPPLKKGNLCSSLSMKNRLLQTRGRMKSILEMTHLQVFNGELLLTLRGDT